jgi:ABC-type transport system substrate-binding protein/class 3 adenylate cyclase
VREDEVTEPRDTPAPESDAVSAAGSAAGPAATELRTFLIADIRGYTTYTREHGDEAGATLAARFAELVGEVVGTHDGFLLEVRGDEALVVFVSARKALRAAVDLQRRFVEAELPRGVGIGLDAGEAIPVGDGYRGTALNLAARLCAQAAAGQTLASEAVIHLAAKVDGIAYVDPRSLRIKGYDTMVRAVVVLPEDLAKGHRRATGSGSPPPDRRRYAAVGALVVAVAILAGVVGGGFLGRGGPEAAGRSTEPGSSAVSPPASPDPLAGVELPALAFFDPATGAVEAMTPMKSPTNISLFRNGSFWILGDNPKAFNRVDPESHEIVQSITIPPVEAQGYTIDERSIWVTDAGSPQAYRIDLRTGISKTFPLGRDADDVEPGSDVAAGAGSVWISRLGDTPEIVRLDPESGEVQARIGDVEAFTLNADDNGLWFAWGLGLGRIDAISNAQSFEPVELVDDGGLGNVHLAGGDAWVTHSASGRVFRVDRGGRTTSYSLAPGVGELSATEDTMWVTNAESGIVTGIDMLTGEQSRRIDTGHSTVSIVAGDDQLMMAVFPTPDDLIAKLRGLVLTVATDGSPWTEPSPDPALNEHVRVQQALYLTCVGLLNYPDEPAPNGWALQPEVAAAMPEVSPDGTTYTFTIRPGFTFSPPSNEEVTAETFRSTIERALSPVIPDELPGPRLLGDIVGVDDFRGGAAEHVTGLTADGDRLTITLTEPAPDFLARLSLPYFCPVPARTPILLSGLDPDPPISGAGPYYIAAAGRHSHVMPRLIVLSKNPNYHGSRPQPFDHIAIRTKSTMETSISKIRGGTLDAAMLTDGEPLAGAGGPLAEEWGPGSDNASTDGQRWFGAPLRTTTFLAFNPTNPAFRDPDVRRAVSLAIDRAALAGAWVLAPSADLLAASSAGSSPPASPAPAPDLEEARALMDGRTFRVEMMGYPTEWGCGVCRDFENAVTGQLKAIGITVAVRHPPPDSDLADAFDAGSTIDLIGWESGTEYPDPVSLIASLADVAWLGATNLEELDRLHGLSGQERIDATAAFADRIVDEEALVVPYGHPINPFFMSERIGCGFVQPAVGAVDLLSLCMTGADASPEPSP